VFLLVFFSETKEKRVIIIKHTKNYYLAIGLHTIALNILNSFFKLFPQIFSTRIKFDGLNERKSFAI